MNGSNCLIFFNYLTFHDQNSGQGAFLGHRINAKETHNFPSTASF